VHACTNNDYFKSLGGFIVFSDSNTCANELVSAIITTHNRKDMVQKAINSVLNQTYPNIELLVVDDASDDDARELLENLSKQKKFTYIYIPKAESKGGNYARNLGIKNSKGKYVALLDDDDEWMPEKISMQVEFLQNNTDCKMVSCLRMREFDYERKVPQKETEIIEGDIKQLVFAKIPFVTSTVLICRDSLSEVGLFDENLSFWQEYELSIRLAQVSKLGYVHQHLCLYRIIKVDPNRLTNKLNGWEKAVEYIENKHKNIINQLPKDIYKKHQLVIARDGVMRATTVGDKKKLRSFLMMQFKCEPTIKNFIKLILNKRNIRG